MFDSFRNNWLGLVVDFDHVYQFQCVDLIRQYLYECYGLNQGVHGDALDYWNATPPVVLSKFTRLQTTEVQQGDIVILRTLNHTDLKGDGHIMIGTGGLNASQFEGLEQNGHGGLPPNTTGDGVGQNRIRTRWVDRSRIAGVLRPIPVPVAPPAEVHPYTIEAITPKQVQLNKDTHKWGLNYDNFTAINKNPEADGHVDDIKTIVAILHHNIGYNYYLEDANVASGWNVHDCNDYTVPAPAPVSVPSQQPAGSIIGQYQTEQYDVLTELTGYLTANKAINHLNDDKTVIVPVGQYFIFNRYFAKGNQELLAVNVSRTPGTAGAWVSVADNHIPTEEELATAQAIREAQEEAAAIAEAAQAEADRLAAEAAAKLPSFVESYTPLEDGPELYVAMRAMNVIDLEGLHHNTTMPQYAATYVAGFFRVGGIEYARPDSAAKRDWWYGIEHFDHETDIPNLLPEKDVYDDKTTAEERRALGRETWEDRLLFALAWLKHLPTVVRNFINKKK
jgi:hypothetical protein